MNIPSFSVKNPIAVIMFFSGIFLLGFISLFHLDLELFPDINYPQATIFTKYTGASPEEIENLISMPIEEAIGTVSGVKKIESYSREGRSVVIVSFKWGTNMDFASLKVREKLDVMMDKLPREADDPIIAKYNPFHKPVVLLNVAGKIPLEKIRETSRNVIKDQLEKIEGVASVEIIGGREREIKVFVDRDKLQSSGYSLLNVVDSISLANLDYPAGSIEDSYYEYLLRVVGRFQSVEDIKDVPLFYDVKTQAADFSTHLQMQERTPRKTISDERYPYLKNIRSGKIVVLKDVADVVNGFKDVTSYSRYNYKDSVQILVNKRSDANAINVSKEIRRRLKEINRMLGKELDVDIVYDQSEFIKSSIYSVAKAGVFGAALAFVILFLFLKNIRTSSIVALVIPVSVFATFILMFFFKVSLNILSLGGIALAVGMLVDSSVVVIENIARMETECKNRENSAVSGTLEVYRAVIASTFTTIAVFIPMVFITGIAGQFFKELAITVTCGLISSLIVSISLIPVLYVKFGRGRTYNVAFIKAVPEFWSRVVKRFDFQWIDSNFRKIIAGILLIILLLIVVSAVTYPFIDKQLMPAIDRRELTIKIRAPQGTSVEKTNNLVGRIEGKLKSIADIKSVAVKVGSDNLKEQDISALQENEAEIQIILSERGGLPKEIAAYLREKIHKDNNLIGLDVKFDISDNPLSSFEIADSPVKILVTGYDLGVLNRASVKMAEIINKVNGVVDVENSFKKANPETRISVARDTAASLGLNVSDIAVLARTAVHGQTASKFREEGNETDITVKVKEEDVKSLRDIENLNVYSPKLNIHVPLKQVADVKKTSGPNEIYRLDQSRTVIVSGNTRGRSLRSIIREVTDFVDKFSQSFSGAGLKMAGENKEARKSFNNLLFALCLSVIMIYMIMASQFESYVQPLIIISVIPLSLVGVIFTLFITGRSLNVITMLGCIMLGGIVVNNGIILVEFINIHFRDYNTPLESAYNAVKVRLRPILITTMTTVFGLLPIAIGMGRGSELESPMAVAVIGGLIFSLGLTLIVVPSLYVLIERFKILKSKKLK